jgi:hypothetical protein
MTHNIIKTENYLLIVSDEIPTTWHYDTYINQVRHTGGAEYGESSITKKVIGHLPLNNSPVLEGVPLLPPLEDEVGELAQAYVINTPDNEPLRVYAFIEGYNKAKEKYKFTEDDLREALFEALNTPKEECCVTHTKDSIVRRVIKSLQQPKMPVAFECEVERIYPNPQNISKEYDFDDILIERKTTTNSQGQTVLVGKYIY